MGPMYHPEAQSPSVDIVVGVASCGWLDQMTRSLICPRRGSSLKSKKQSSIVKVLKNNFYRKV